MRKEEIRHDPIREYIVKCIEYLQDKQSTVLKVFLGLVVIVAAFSYYNHAGSMRNENASIIAGLAQSSFINGEIDEAIVKFERVMKDYPSTFGATQSFIYLLNDAMTQGKYEVVLNLISQYPDGIDSIDDPIVKAAIYKIKGDILLFDGKYVDAHSFYKKASINSKGTSIQIGYQLDSILALLKQKKYNEAHKILEDIFKIEDLDYNVKNKAEELKAFVNYNQDT